MNIELILQAQKLGAKYIKYINAQQSEVVKNGILNITAEKLAKVSVYSMPLKERKAFIDEIHKEVIAQYADNYQIVPVNSPRDFSKYLADKKAKYNPTI